MYYEANVDNYFLFTPNEVHFSHGLTSYFAVVMSG